MLVAGKFAWVPHVKLPVKWLWYSGKFTCARRQFACVLREVLAASKQVNLPVFTGKLHGTQVNCARDLFTCELHVKLPAFAGNFARANFTVQCNVAELPKFQPQGLLAECKLVPAPWSLVMVSICSTWGKIFGRCLFWQQPGKELLLLIAVPSVVLSRKAPSRDRCCYPKPVLTLVCVPGGTFMGLFTGTVDATALVYRSVSGSGTVIDIVGTARGDVWKRFSEIPTDDRN